MPKFITTRLHHLHARFIHLHSSHTYQFFSRHKAILSFFGLLSVILIVLGITVRLIESPQDQRSQAASGSCTVDVYALEAVEEEYLQLLNNYRQDRGLSPLRPSGTLFKAAQWMAEDLVQRNIQPKDHQDSLGRNPDSRFAACGFMFTSGKIGENIAANTTGTAQSMFDQWQSSPGHKEKMDDPLYQQTGLGRARNANGMWFWVQTFASGNDGTSPEQGTEPTPTTPQATPTQFPPTITPTTSPGACNDPDGLNFNVKTGDDSCYPGNMTPNTLIEYYCEGDTMLNLSYRCPEGCFDGKCINPAPTGIFCMKNADCPAGYSCPPGCENEGECDKPIFACQPSNSNNPTPTPTSTTPTPTPTTPANSSRINFSFKIVGVGTNTGIGENPTPVRDPRELSYAVVDNDLNVGSGDFISASYNYTTSTYAGSFLVETSELTAGRDIWLGLDNTLIHVVAADSLTNGNTIPLFTFTSGNIAYDTEVDLADYNELVACIKINRCEPERATHDLNDDGIIDIVDLNILLGEFPR